MKKLLAILGVSLLLVTGNVQAGVKEVLLDRLISNTASHLVCEDLANNNKDFQRADRIRTSVNTLWKGLGKPSSRIQYDIDNAYTEISNWNKYYLEDQCGKF